MQPVSVAHRALPEFRNIDSLVVPDFYHRTRDEHSFGAPSSIFRNLPRRRTNVARTSLPCGEPWIVRDLLILSLLLHDVGKGMPVESHVAGSLQRWKRRGPPENSARKKKAKLTPDRAPLICPPPSAPRHF